MSRPATTPRLLRRINAQLVLDALRAGGPQRVTELMARTGLSRPTVDAVAADLLRLGWVTEMAPREPAPRRGRPARWLAFRADAGYVAGLDIGEVKVRAAVADLSGEIVGEQVREFATADRMPEIRRVAAATLEAAGVRGDQVLAACVGCTGAMDPGEGRVVFSGALPEDFDLRGAMEPVLGRSVTIENDCNLAVLAERWRGAAPGVDDVIAVLAAERIGAGIVVGGKLLRGHAGAAGELAFTTAYAAEPGVVGIAPLLRSVTGSEPEAAVERAGAGDPEALGAFERAARWAALGIVTVSQVVNPELVVISGGAAAGGDVFLEPLRRLVVDAVRIPPRIEASPLGARGPLLGAIRRALDDLEPRLLAGLEAAA